MNKQKGEFRHNFIINVFCMFILALGLVFGGNAMLSTHALQNVSPDNSITETVNALQESGTAQEQYDVIANQILALPVGTFYSYKTEQLTLDNLDTLTGKYYDITSNNPELVIKENADKEYKRLTTEKAYFCASKDLIADASNLTSDDKAKLEYYITNYDNSFVAVQKLYSEKIGEVFNKEIKNNEAEIAKETVKAFLKNFSLRKPQPAEEKLYYNLKEQLLKFNSDFKEEFMWVKLIKINGVEVENALKNPYIEASQLKARDAGTYTVLVGLKDASKAAWEGDSPSEDYEVEFIIHKHKWNEDDFPKYDEPFYIPYDGQKHEITYDQNTLPTEFFKSNMIGYSGLTNTMDPGVHVRNVIFDVDLNNCEEPPKRTITIVITAYEIKEKNDTKNEKNFYLSTDKNQTFHPNTVFEVNEIKSLDDLDARQHQTIDKKTGLNEYVYKIYDVKFSEPDRNNLGYSHVNKRKNGYSCTFKIKLPSELSSGNFKILHLYEDVNFNNRTNETYYNKSENIDGKFYTIENGYINLLNVSDFMTFCIIAEEENNPLSGWAIFGIILASLVFAGLCTILILFIMYKSGKKSVFLEKLFGKREKNQEKEKNVDEVKEYDLEDEIEKTAKKKKEIKEDIPEKISKNKNENKPSQNKTKKKDLEKEKLSNKEKSASKKSTKKTSSTKKIANGRSKTKAAKSQKTKKSKTSRK